MIEQTFGSKAQVWHGTAKKTSGGLTKSNLMKNKHGRIVSRRKHTMGKKSIKHLRKLGYIAKKGKFTLFHKGRKGSRKMRGGQAPTVPTTGTTGTAGTGSATMGTNVQNIMNKVAQNVQASTSGTTGGTTAPMMPKKGGRSRRMRGGMAYGGPLSPQAYDGAGQGTSGVALQFVAGNSA